jgi:hypothetical protein
MSGRGDNNKSGSSGRGSGNQSQQGMRNGGEQQATGTGKKTGGERSRPMKKLRDQDSQRNQSMDKEQP